MPPPVLLSWRLLLLPQERLAFRWTVDRFATRGLPNAAQRQMVRKHGTLGLVLFVIVAMTACFFDVAAISGIVLLIVSDGARFAYWVVAVGVGGNLYAMLRLTQAALIKPSGADLDYLEQVGP